MTEKTVIETPQGNAAPTPIEPAATLVIVRASSDGIQVLMQQRNPEAAFAGGAWVFPGGKLDPEDSDPGWQNLVQQIDITQASQALYQGRAAQPYNASFIDPSDIQSSSATPAIAYWIAALREAYEECGILLSDTPSTQQQRHAWRQQLLTGKCSWQHLIKSHSIELAVAKMHYLSRWITPANNVRRYDARFFITEAPLNQQASHENHEAIDTCWITPKAALQAWQNKEMSLILPTLTTLQVMQQISAQTHSCNLFIEKVCAVFHQEGSQ